MGLANGKIVSVFLCLINLRTASFVEIGHIHVLSVGSHSTHQLQSHDCGKNERHKPLGSEKHCLLCQQINQFVSILNAISLAAAIQAQPLTFSSSSFHHSQEANFYFFNRAPPLSFSNS